MVQPILPNNLPQNRGLKIVGRCPSCGKPYDFRSLQILGERGQSILTYIECPHCASAILSIFSLNPMGLSAQAMITDLTSEEVTRLTKEERVSSDDVLGIHQLLEEDKFTID